MNNGYRIATLVLAVSLTGGCATTLPTPELKVAPADITYLSVSMADQPIGLYMTEIVAGGALGSAINGNNRSQSRELWEKVKTDDRAQSLPKRLREQIIARAKGKGVTLADAEVLKGRSLTANEQKISVVNAMMQYRATTWVSTYAPVGAAVIESSRDPAVPQGQQRTARMVTVRVDDGRYSFLTAGGVLEDPSKTVDGAVLAADALAERIADDLAKAQSKQ